MAVTYAAPVADASTADPQLYVSFPISKMEKDARGNLVIKGVATDATVDSDHQIVDADWSAKALTDWLASGGNVRMSHDSKRPIGKGVQVELDRDGDGKHWVKSVIVDPLAIRLVEEGVLRAYSVGIIDPVIKRDPTGRAPGGIICGGALAELSVVDRPANKNAYLELAKAAADGSARFTGTMYADPQLVALVEESIGALAADDIIDVPLPAKAQISVTPADMAALLKARGATLAKRDFDENVGGGTDRDKIPSSDFAGRDRSFPIVSPSDVSDAARSIGRAGGDNYSSDQLKSNIIRIARRKGPSFVAELPDAWTDSKEKAMNAEPMDAAEMLAKGKKAFPGAAPPMDGKDSDGDGADTDKPDSHLDDDKNKPDKVKPGSAKKGADSADPDDEDDSYSNEDANKPEEQQGTDADSGQNSASKSETEIIEKGMKDCPKCGKGYHADSKMKRCEGCNAKLPKADKGARITEGRTQPTPADGVTGESAAPVARHREPDGPAIEQFEADMKIPTDPDSNYVKAAGPGSLYMKAAMRLKSLNVPYDMGALHDMLCPAYDPADVAKAHPFSSLGQLDAHDWQLKALDAAAGAPLSEAKAAAVRWQHAVTITETHPGMIEELRNEAFKAFGDANMGPASAPKPTEISASRFNRPLITAGHARPSRFHDGPNTAPEPSGQVAASQFNRDYITDGRAENSPANKADATDLIDVGVGTGVPHRVFYSNAQKENARAAMAALHDHICQSFPDLCPMHTSKTSEAEAEKSTSVPEQVSETQAADVVKKKKPKKPMAEAVDPEMVKAMLAEMLAPLTEQLAEANKALAVQRKENKELRKTVDAIASQPDPASSPWRGQAVFQQTYKGFGTTEKSASMDAAEIAGKANAALQRELEYQFNTSADPAAREAAWAALARMRGMR